MLKSSSTASPFLFFIVCFNRKLQKLVYEAIFANLHPCDRLILTGAWLTGRRNSRAAVNVMITGFGSTKQRNHGQFVRADLPGKLQQGKLEVQTDEK